MDTFVGIDLHKAFSQVHVQSQEGNRIDEVCLYHDDVESIRQFFSGLGGDVHVAVEATMGWMWLNDELQQLGADVHLAHQKKNKAISEARPKTDSVDAKGMAQLLNCSPRTVRRLADSGRMPAPIRLGRLARWNSETLRSWITEGCPSCKTGR